MPPSPTSTFQDALELVEGLPEEQQTELIEIVLRRRSERERQALLARVRQGRDGFASGEVRRGTPDDLLREIGE